MQFATWFFLGILLGWMIFAGGRRLYLRLPETTRLTVSERADFLLFLILPIAVLAAWFAIAIDNASLPMGFLVLRSFFLGGRFQAIIIGLVLGALANKRRHLLTRGVSQFYASAIGDAGKTAWAFQSAIALLLVALVVLAIRPEFLDYLRSLKVGGVEATFAERSAAAIKEADLHLDDLREEISLLEYARFGPDYIYSESARGQARKLFGPKELEDEAGPIAELLMSGYFHPVIVSVVCLNEVHEIGSVSHDTDLASFVYAWEHLLLSTHDIGTLSDDLTLDGNNEKIRTDKISIYLARMRNSGLAVARRVSEIAPSCIDRDMGPLRGFRDPKEPPREFAAAKPKASDCALPYDASLISFLDQQKNNTATKDSPEIKRDAACVEKHYELALQALQKHSDDKPPIISLMVTDAYLVGATADLIALISGHQKDKAIFLTRMLDQFPHQDRFVTPGIINAFHEVSDARVRTIGSWSLQQTLTDLNYALHGAELLVSKSSDWLTHNAKIDPPAKRCGETDGTLNEQEQQVDLVWCVYDIYMRNTVIVLTTKLELFNQIELSNRSMPEISREEWRDTLGRLVTLLKARSASAIAIPATISLSALDARQTEVLPTMDIEQDQIVDADLAAALSVLLIEDPSSTPSPLSCNLSLFFVDDADQKTMSIIDNLSFEKTGHLKYDKTQETRWRQLVAVVAQRVSDLCAWHDQRSPDVTARRLVSDKASKK